MGYFFVKIKKPKLNDALNIMAKYLKDHENDIVLNINDFGELKYIFLFQ